MIEIKKQKTLIL